MRFLSVLLSGAIALSAVLTWASATPERAFEDVGPTHRAYASVQRAYQDGIINGISYDEATGKRMFGADDPLTALQFTAMLVRAFYSDEQAGRVDPSPYWYAAPLEVANRYCLLRGLSADREGGIDTAMTRNEMAMVLMNLLSSFSYEADRNARTSMEDVIPDWAYIGELYRDAVDNAVQLGLVIGVDQVGVFYGERTLSRAQGAVLYCRLADHLAGRSAVKTSSFMPGIESGLEIVADTPYLLSDAGTCRIRTLSGRDTRLDGLDWRTKNEAFGQSSSPSPIALYKNAAGSALVSVQGEGIASVQAVLPGRTSAPAVCIVVIDVESGPLQDGMGR